MGEPRFSRRRYERPFRPWDEERIKKEDEVLRKYALKNKKELWKAESYLRRIRAQARELRARIKAGEKQGEREYKLLIRRLYNIGLLQNPDATLDDVLTLNVESVLSRRLSTLVYLKGFAGTPSQARQFINHGHIGINGKKVTVPGMLVNRVQEQNIGYVPGSPLSDLSHPMRPQIEFGQKPPRQQIEGKEV